MTGLKLDVTCRPLRDSEVRVHAPVGKYQGFTRRFLGWLSFAEENNFELLIALIDEDDERQRHNEVELAQASDVFSVRRAFGVAVQAFDAWMLADEKAISKVLGTVIPKIGSPERHRNPKARFLEVREQSEVRESARELYRQIAKELDVDSLALACPKGFKPFADRLRRLSTSPSP
ncbi:MAG: DUF4276 family protein [Planctomycetia bacterium]|nr:DUF4276 family protein [Planctomycetia bacterium]